MYLFLDFLKIEVYLIYNVSGVQQSDSVIYVYMYVCIYTHINTMCIYVFFQILFHYRLL